MKMSPRLALLVIAAVFLLPLVLAWLMYNGTIDFRPAATRNRGALVQPPVAIEWEQLSVMRPDGNAQSHLANHWAVLHAVPSDCGPSCVESVTALRQVHRAAGRNQARIRLVLLLEAPDAALAERLQAIYPEFLLIPGSGATLRQALRQAALAAQGPPDAAGGSYLVDPLGNIMMYYQPGSDPNDLKQDLKRLLTWSKLDESK